MCFRKVLSDIEAFSDIYYKSCFYNALFPVIKYFKRSNFKFLLSDIYIYDYDDIKNELRFRPVKLYDNASEQILEALEILKELGISSETKILSNNIIDDIKSSISLDRPVIIFIDCFYESIKVDTYLKKHIPHYLLVYGYDNLDEIFYITEHRYLDSSVYENTTISYSEIINCYNGFIDNYLKNVNTPTFYEFYHGGSNWDEHAYDEMCISDFINEMLMNKELIFDRLEYIKIYADAFMKIASDEILLKEKIDDLLNNLNSIINLRSVERYRMLKVFKLYDDMANLLESIINEWQYIRAFLAKYKYSLKYNPKHLCTVIDKFGLIYKEEKQYHEMLFEFLYQLNR